MPSVKTPRAPKGESREVILEAAAGEFARHGFAGARIDAIADRTGLNVRMIYYHFKSKEGLYEAVLESIYRNMATILDVAPLQPGDLEGGAIAAFERYVDLLGANPRFADILVREAIDGGARLRALFQAHPDLFDRVHRRAHELLAASMKTGAVRPLDPVLVVQSLTGMACLLIASREALPVFTAGRAIDPGQWKQVMIDLFRNGLLRR